jgi:SAM-dependent methyltransferase
MPDLSSLDWDALDRLRAVFLAREAAASGPYWKNQSTLAAYDATYGERIGWKWDALLAELRLRAWQPPVGTMLLDFGCGSGVAGRRILAAFGPNHFAGLSLIDHSPEAVAFAATRARTTFPSLKVQTTPEPIEPYTLVVSHVLNELAPEGRSELLALASRASAVLWVEPGTHADGRALATVRDELRRAHRIVAPCTHRENCPLFIEANGRDWCHFFASPPPGVQNSPDWVRFAHRAGVDLRSQAYACLVLENLSSAGSVLPASVSARVLGRPEVFKPYARLLTCDATGLHWLELAKRTDPALVKRLTKDPPLPLYVLTHNGRKISAATPLFSPTAPAAATECIDEDL